MRTIRWSGRVLDNPLHIKAPGCIVNIHRSDDGSRVRVDVIADGDRYAGEPAWWARGSVERSGGVVLIEREEVEAR